MLLLIGGGVGLLLLLLGGGGLVWYLVSKDDSSTQQASSSAPVSTPKSTVPIGMPKGNPFGGPTPKMTIQPPVNIPPVGAPPVIPQPPIVPAGFSQPPQTLEEALARLQDPDAKTKRDGLDFIRKTPVDAGRRSEVAKAIDPLLTDPDLRETAAQSLASWATKENVPSLIKLLAIEQGNAWRPAIDILGKLKDERAAESLAKSLTNFFRRGPAQNALQTLGPVAEPEVVKYLHHKDNGVRQVVDTLLRGYNTKDSVRLDQTIADLGAAEVETRQAAAEDLTRTKLDKNKQAEVSQALDKLLTDSDARVRQTTARALKVWATNVNVLTLNTLLDGNDPFLKDRAFELLGQLKDERSIPVLLQHLMPLGDRSKASTALKAISRGVEKPVLQALPAQQDLGIARELIHILGAVGTKTSIPILRAYATRVRQLQGDALNAINQILARGK
jgi:HEAT repeat protein